MQDLIELPQLRMVSCRLRLLDVHFEQLVLLGLLDRLDERAELFLLFLFELRVLFCDFILLEVVFDVLAETLNAVSD